MRRVAIVAVSAAALLAMAGIAYAVNAYTSSNSISPSKTGTPSSPNPVSETLRFGVSDTSAGNRPLPLTRYSLGLGPGIVPRTSLFGGCSALSANATPLPRSCKQSVVGSGFLVALLGPSSNRSGQYSSRCYLDLTLINSTRSNHLNVRVDTRDTTSSPNFSCPVRRHQSIDATFVRRASVTAAGLGSIAASNLVSTAINFSAPSNLQSDGANDFSVIQGQFGIKKKQANVFTGTGRRRHRVTHGYIESVGCPKNPTGKREVTLIFSDKGGATTSTASRSNCTK